MSTTNSSSQVQRLFGRVKNNRSIVAILTFTPLIVFFGLIWFIPIAYGLSLSFFERSILSSEMTWIGLENYQTIIESSTFWDALVNGVLYAVSTTVLSLLIGLLFALTVNAEFFGRRLTQTLMMLPYLIPSVITIALWKFLLAPSGVVNYYLTSWGIIQENIEFFSSLTFAMPSLVIASTWIYSAFAFFTILGKLQSIPPSYYERARVEGATRWQMFRDITLPHLRGVILLVALVRGIFLFNKFDMIWVATKGGPLGATTTIPILIYKTTFNDYALGQATALAAILFLFLIIVAAVYFRVFKPSQEVTQ